MKKTKLIVLDFNKGITYIYTLEKKLRDYKQENIEQFIEFKGHKINNCQWMITENEVIIN